MSEPVRPICPLCNGAEVIYLSDTEVDTCQCLRARLLRKHLGIEVASAVTRLQSPLLSVVDDAVRVDHTGKNLLIRATWPDFLSHLKWVLYCKGGGFRFRVTTDEKIRTVYVGAESYMARAKSRRDDLVTFNTLADLVGPDYSLVVIRLGQLGHKNVAAPGALKEALMLRESACLPTWVVETPELPFGLGCYSYSDDVASYIERHYTTFGLAQEVESPATPVFEVIEDIALTMDPTEMRAPVQSAPVQSRFQPQVSTDMDLPGSGCKRQRGSWKKKSGGAGPV